jgi:hypothetical protein
MPRTRYKGYLSRAETMTRLGIDREMLETFVRNGRLERVIPPGRRQGYFRAEQVSALSQELQAFIAVNAPSRATFSRAAPEEMDEAAKLINALFDHRPNVERWKEYLRRNPDIGYFLRADDQIVGCAFIFPLAAGKIEQIFSYEETQAPPIDPDDIQPCEPDVPVHLYIRAVGIMPHVPRRDRRFWGGQLLGRLLRVFVGFGERGIVVKTVQARSRTPEGIRILRHMGFTEVRSSTTSHNFVIDVEASGLPVIEEYREALARWRQEHPSAGSH